MTASPDEDTVLTHLFVLRLWRERAATPWRAALRPADATSPIGFADLEQLAAFLLRLADRPASSAALERAATPPEAPVTDLPIPTRRHTR